MDSKGSIKYSTFQAYEKEAEGLIKDQARIIAEQKETIEQLREALKLGVKTIEEIKKVNPN